MHTDGGPCVFTGTMQSDLVDAFHQIGRDRENRLVIWTGTGESWMAAVDFPTLGDVTDPRQWDHVYTNERKLLLNLVEIDVPMICAVNGPALLHTEFILTMDIVIASDTAEFQDYPHLTHGIVPGDGVQALWQEVLGPIRGRYWLWMQERLTAADALRLGVVSEVLSPEDLMPRAREIAAHLAKQPTLNLRLTRQALNQRTKRLLHEALGFGLALEGLTAIDKRNGWS